MAVQNLAWSKGQGCHEQGATPEQPLTVYFDGSCALCSTEIRHYQRLGEAAPLHFVDVAGEQKRPADDLSRSDAMRRFHVRCADGELVSGAAAFALLWENLPAWRWVARLHRLPGVAAIMEGGYRVTLVIRPALSRIAARLGAKPFQSDLSK